MLLNRRALFTTLGAGIIALAGCAVGDPRVSEPNDGWTPTPTPPSPRRRPEIQAALDRETSLAGQAEAIAAAPGANSVFVAGLVAAHQDHAEVLRTQFGHVDASPSSTFTPPAVLAEAVPGWVENLTAAAGEHREQALLASGHLGLVLASCASFAAVAAAVAPAMTATVADTGAGEFMPVTDAVALPALLAQLHAARYAYQTALGAFQLSDERRPALVARTTALTDLRDDITAALVDRDVAPPAAEPAYQVDRPASVDAAIAMTAEIESRLLPFIGQAVAGVLAGDDLRPALVDQLSATARRLVLAGGTLPRWPGR